VLIRRSSSRSSRSARNIPTTVSMPILPIAHECLRRDGSFLFLTFRTILLQSNYSRSRTLFCIESVLLREDRQCRLRGSGGAGVRLAAGWAVASRPRARRWHASRCVEVAMLDLFPAAGTAKDKYNRSEAVLYSSSWSHPGSKVLTAVGCFKCSRSLSPEAAFFIS